MEVIGVDIGGTNIKAGLVYNGKLVKSKIAPTGKKKKDILANLKKIISELISSKTLAIGIGCPGPANYNHGIIGNAPNLPLKGVNLKRTIQRKFNLPVVINNDAQCFVLGESIRLNKPNLVGLTLGTGVGGGIVFGGKIYSGSGNAGELGYTTLKFDGPKDKTGSGTMEGYFSAKGIIRRYKKEPTQLSMPQWKDYGRRLGIGISNLVWTFDPGTIVLGGGITKAYPKFKPSLLREIKKITRKTKLFKVKVVVGRTDSGIMGSAHLAYESVKSLGKLEVVDIN